MVSLCRGVCKVSRWRQRNRARSPSRLRAQHRNITTTRWRLWVTKETLFYIFNSTVVDWTCFFFFLTAYRLLLHVDHVRHVKNFTVFYGVANFPYKLLKIDGDFLDYFLPLCMHSKVLNTIGCQPCAWIVLLCATHCGRQKETTRLKKTPSS